MGLMEGLRETGHGLSDSISWKGRQRTMSLMGQAMP